MDDDLKKIISLAMQRGSHYIKKGYPPDKLPEQMAELGVDLLCRYERLVEMKGSKEALKELNELHQKIDHFRKELFLLKRKIIE
jgi:hypothetical protein